jgi:hypothetical protein
LIISRCCWLLLLAAAAAAPSAGIFEKNFEKKFQRARARRAGKIKI